MVPEYQGSSVWGTYCAHMVFESINLDAWREPGVRNPKPEILNNKPSGLGQQSPFTGWGLDGFRFRGLGRSGGYKRTPEPFCHYHVLAVLVVEP